MLTPPKDALGPARGVMNGLALSVILWAIIFYLCV